MIRFTVVCALLTTLVGCSEGCLPNQEHLGSMKVKYGGVDIQYNQTVALQSVTKAPELHADPFQGNLLLVMVDPDAPSVAQCPESTYFLHWLRVVKIEGGKIINELESDVVDYFKPSPPAGSGPHRYQFMLYQLGNIRPQDVKATDRSPFNLDNFMSELKSEEEEEDQTLVASFQFKAENSG